MKNNITTIRKNEIAVASTPVCDDVLLFKTSSPGVLGLVVFVTTSDVLENLTFHFPKHKIIELVVDEKMNNILNQHTFLVKKFCAQ